MTLPRELRRRELIKVFKGRVDGRWHYKCYYCRHRYATPYGNAFVNFNTQTYAYRMASLHRRVHTLSTNLTPLARQLRLAQAGGKS